MSISNLSFSLPTLIRSAPPAAVCCAEQFGLNGRKWDGACDTSLRLGHLADRSPKLLKCQNKSARMGLLTSHKALRSKPFRKTRKRNTSYVQKLNKLQVITSFSSSSTGSPPATPFNSTTFLMGLQQLREFEHFPRQLKFDQYGSMEHLLACWPLHEPSPDQANLINDGYDTVHEDVLIASSSPTSRSGDYYAVSEHGGIAGSLYHSMEEEDGRIVQNTHHSFITGNHEYDQECSSNVESVLRSNYGIQLCRSEISSLQYGATNGLGK